MKKKAKVIPALEVAFPASLPVMAGYLFLGMSYGILMNVSGFSFLWPMGMALTIYGGSVEFLVANMLLGSFHPLQTFLMAFIVNARHLFYGLAMLDKFLRHKKKPRDWWTIPGFKTADSLSIFTFYKGGLIDCCFNKL